jgi:glycosyltransferase involved in cell wall biosynthesis
VTIPEGTVRDAVLRRIRDSSAARRVTPRLRQALGRLDAGTDGAADTPSAPVLRYGIDEPEAGTTMTGTVRVRGWAAMDDRPVLAVAVRLDGRLVGRAVTGTEPRADVAEALGWPQLRGAGWSVDADVGVGVPTVGGTSELVVTVWPDGGGAPVALPPIPVTIAVGAVGPDDVEADEINARIDGLEDGATIGSDAVRLEGWVYHDRFVVSSLDVLANGRHVGRARLGLPRLDLDTQGAPTHVAVSGFEFVLDLDLIPAAERVVRVQLVATVSGGHPVVVATAVLCRPSADGADEADEAVVPVGPGGSPHRVGTAAPGRGRDVMDLVVFTHHLGYGGGQLWLSELLARADAGRSFPCTVVAPADGPLRAELEQAGIRVHVTQPFPFDSLASYEGRLEELSLLVAAGGHTAALVNTLPAAIGADVTRRMGIPTVWAVHESLPASTLWFHALGAAGCPPGIRRRFEETLRDTSALVFEAEATRRIYAPLAGRGRCLVIPYGIDTGAVGAFAASASREQVRRELGIAIDRKVALVMGTTEPRKAQIRLAQAFGSVADDHSDWDLVFVGDNDTSYAEALQRLVAESGLDQRVRLIPVTPDIYPWYRSADLLVSASDVESLPRSALEAMCFGVPVLATSIFGLPELITDGETGFLFEPGDLDALVAAFRRVFGLGPSHLAEVGTAARQLILDRYDSAGYASDIISLLDQMRRDPGIIPVEAVASRVRHPVSPERPTPVRSER